MSATKCKTTTEAKAAKTAKKAKPGDVTGWASFGVIFTLCLSGMLNGYANAQHAPIAWAGWAMGLAVPVILLFLSKIAGEKWLKNQRGPAWLAGGSGLALLLLSVYHCSESIALLTGSGMGLAIPMALAIDGGLVACEVALITEKKGKR